jgi:hypothetical protein
MYHDGLRIAAHRSRSRQEAKSTAEALSYVQFLATLMFSKCQTSWKDFLAKLKARGLSGVEFVVCDDHA